MKEIDKLKSQLMKPNLSDVERKILQDQLKALKDQFEKQPHPPKPKTTPKMKLLERKYYLTTTEADAKGCRPLHSETDPADDTQTEKSNQAGSGPKSISNKISGKTDTEDTSTTDDTLLKPVAEITQGEIDQVMGDPDFGRMNDRSRALADKAQQWFDHVWGAGPVARDETGRTAIDTPVNPPPTKPTPLKDATGRPVDDALKAIRAGLDRIVADAAEPEDETAAVKALQRAVNLAPKLAAAPTAPKPDRPQPVTLALPAIPGLQPALTPPVKVDGVLGNKTRKHARAAATALGAPKLREGVALGRFQGFAEDAARKSVPAPALRRVVETGFGPLFDGARPGFHKDDRKPKPEVTALQDSLNGLGGTAASGSTTPALKVDGFAGPKTADAFAQAVRRDGPAKVTDAFGKRLGFLGDDEDDQDGEDGTGFGFAAPR